MVTRRPEPTYQVAVGDVLDLPVGSRLWWVNDPMRLRVTRVRDDLSQYYDGELVWIEGYELGPDGDELGWTQELVRTKFLPQRPT